MFKNNFFKSIALMLVITFLSCNRENIVFNEFRDLPNSNWSYLDTLNFDVSIADTLNYFDVDLQLRTSTDYKWSNMYLYAEIDFPNGKSRSDTFQLFITDKKGHWNGEKSGLLVNFQYSLYRKIKFPIKGKYHFKLNQAMRDTILENILSLGFKITNSTEYN